MEPLDFGEPLPKVTCTSTKCEDGLHCFRPKRAKAATMTGGACHACQKDLINWPMVHQRDIAQVDMLFTQMRNELIRHRFWNMPLSDTYKRTLYHQGKAELREKVDKRLLASVHKAGCELFRDGMQTPVDEQNIIYYAQHATATCCRKCIKYWHNIPYDRPLEPAEETYLQELIMRYIETRLPGLPAVAAQLTLSL